MHSRTLLLCAAALLGAACSKSKTEPASAPITGTASYRGMYSYMADAGWFVDCRSGARLAVAQEGDNAALEAAYSKDQSMLGAPLLATVEGRIEDRMPMEGPGPRPTLIVEKFISVASEGCSGPSSTAALQNTYWKLMTLNNHPVESPEGARELHLVLNSEEQRVKGFSGCNSFAGEYEIQGPKIKFERVAGTMMACAGDMGIEQQMHEMLGHVAGWQISGETLRLQDEDGMPIATFESRYMK